ncbi:chemotaxis protein CheB [Lichenibacterium dinghuense]|uniref:chemotaxis protein CheB n=1 Tax=Lichenibacterium dinghuense TaxID=2895977 RepID=UPI0021033459|nr:chemotaxis protein CheB [Lichenibacterium sp. 6Y81]
MAPRRDIIVIGASRGGVDALRRVVGNFPVDLPAAVLIVLHTAPDSPMAMADILGRSTAMPVDYAEQGSRIEPGQVYIAPPGWHTAVVAESVLELHHGEPVNFSRPAVDVLFRSAAQVYGSRVIGVVLTGGDHDGTAGLRAIKLAGGISVVQKPQGAVDPGMPMSAIYGDSPDHVVPLGEMAKLLVRLVGFGRMPS